MLPRSDVSISRSDIDAEYIETRQDGAVFEFRVNTSGVDPEEAARRGRNALDVVDTFCNRVLNEDEEPVIDWDGVGAFKDWPCEGESMIVKYSGLGGDGSQMAVIISHRYLATCFVNVFCRGDSPGSERRR